MNDNADQVPFSPLMLCDRLLNLAQQADRAGFRDAAGRLVVLAQDVCEPAERLRANPPQRR
jgi:hypothetical protein